MQEQSSGCCPWFVQGLKSVIKQEILLHGNALVTCLQHAPCEDVPGVLGSVSLRIANSWVRGSHSPLALVTPWAPAQHEH